MTFATLLSPHRRAVVPETVLVRVLGEESVLLSLESESYFGLDAIGTRMWDAMAGAPSLAAAFDQLSDEYDVDPAQLREDMARLVEELSGAGLVRIIDV